MKPHPNLVTLLGICSNPEKPRCIIMEYVDGELIKFSFSNCQTGGTLRDYVLKNKIDLQQALKFGKDISAGMSHLHSEGFLHCDLAAR